MESEFNRGHLIARCPLKRPPRLSPERSQADENTWLSSCVSQLLWVSCLFKGTSPGVCFRQSAPNSDGLWPRPSARIQALNGTCNLRSRANAWLAPARRHPPAPRPMSNWDHQQVDVCRFDRSADCTTPRDGPPQPRIRPQMRLRSPRAAAGLAGADRPDRLVGHHQMGWQFEIPQALLTCGEINPLGSLLSLGPRFSAHADESGIRRLGLGIAGPQVDLLVAFAVELRVPLWPTIA